ncbi:hypothetical protein RIF29_04945 [Crotalaria pallida]|uniref:Uncharacterized protein n=1 Tax=Crotalaria pallida TaxID=3830 RepID=A0AAN9J1H5_CROPI
MRSYLPSPLFAFQSNGGTLSSTSVRASSLSSLLVSSSSPLAMHHSMSSLRDIVTRCSRSLSHEQGGRVKEKLSVPSRKGNAHRNHNSGHSHLSSVNFEFQENRNGKNRETH